MAQARTFSLPTITNEAAELLALTETVAIAPIIAFAERVNELNVSVLANLYFGQIGATKSTVVAYVTALSKLDAQVADLEDEVSRMNPDEDDEYAPEDWAHAILDLQARAQAMVMTNGMGMPVLGAPAGGGGGGLAKIGTEEDGGYERLKHTAMRKAYGWTFEESQLGSRADQIKIKAQVVGEYSWPSHQRVPYHKLQDAEGGRTGDPGGFMLTATQDGKVHVEEKNGSAESKDLDSTRELLTQYQILLRTILFVGVDVKPPGGYDADGTGMCNDGTGDTYIVGMQEVMAMIAVLDSKSARSIPKSALHELLKNLTKELRELTREPSLKTVGAALKSVRPHFAHAVVNASMLADQQRAAKKQADEDEKKRKAAAQGGGNGGGNGKWNGGGGGGGNGQRFQPYGGNGGGGRNGGGGNWFNGNNGNNNNGNNNNNSGNNGNTGGKGNGGGGGKGGGGNGNGGGGAGWSYQHPPGGGPRPPPGAPPSGGRQAGGNPNAPPCMDFQRGRCNRAQCAFAH